MAKVYHFTVWDHTNGVNARQQYKSTRERIESIKTAELIEDSEEEVLDSLLDDGRYVPRA